MNDRMESAASAPNALAAATAATGLAAATAPTGLAAASDRACIGTELTLASGSVVVSSSVEQSDYSAFARVDAAHYRADRELARGGMGRIRVARDRRLGRAVAIKELLVRSDGLAARFEREARITARLQHPSIMPVYEAGAWASGAPFFAMKLVKGRALDEVIADATSLDARLALLPNVLAVADAIAYAHSEGVIHRDLKPRNLLVGAFGETVVIDWGLAKELASQDLPASSERLPRDGGGLETEDGEVMGTPAYMPPEQAQGLAVDQRADVYALGAILFHVLAGRPPIAGRSTIEVLAKAVEGDRLSLRELEPDVPPDLLAIVDKALASDPAQRYPSALELAADLRRYQTGQLVGAHRYSFAHLARRWLRRHRAAVSVAAIAVAVLAVLGVVSLRRIIAAEHTARTQRDRAEEHRGRAESNQTEVEDLLDFMLVDMRGKLQPLGRTDLLAEVAHKAASYHDRHADESAPEALSRRAQSLLNVGAVLEVQGDNRAALAKVREAVSLAERAVGTSATFANLGRLSAAQLSLAQTLRGENDVESIAVAERAFAIRRLLVALRPADVHARRDLAIALDAVGTMHATTDTATALAHMQQARSIHEELVRDAPTDPDRKFRLAGVLERLSVLMRRTHAPDADVPLVRAAELGEELVRSDPTNMDYKIQLAYMRLGLGKHHAIEHARKAALEQFHAALILFEELAATDATNLQRQADVAGVHRRIGQVLLEQKDLAGAVARFQASLAAAERCALLEPSSPRWQDLVAHAHDELGRAFTQTRDLVGAARELRASLTLRDALVKQQPDSIEHRYKQAAAQADLADALLAAHDVRAARALYNASLVTSQWVAKRDPQSVDSHRALAASYDKVADGALAGGDTAAAVTARRAALAVSKQVADKIPGNRDLALNVMFRHEMLALAQLRARDKAGARRSFVAALEAAKVIQDKHPELCRAPEVKQLVADLTKRIRRTATRRGRR